ncbi:protein phosphatase 1 regulatory subunit 26 [Cynocephalus volans]|uniref:protein phosphatase 1 regulatory subunit 26 n=1 Tax=Cynocephalus volans TaxID=110931 RepID=UPI002FCA0C29
MFLMNAPPVVALQSKWEAFGPPGSFRFPGCFSESNEGVERASVSAKVQMIISTLQRDEVALGMSNARTAQRSQKAERCHDARLAASPTVRKEQPAFAACGLTAEFDPPGEEEAANFGPLVLDSDSDDSVDRDIEEAIQEYLKAKSGAGQAVSSGAPPGRAQPSGATGGGSRCKPEPVHSSTPAALCPTKLALGSGSVPGSHMGASEDRGSASPVSVSSDDSFEQSIRAEIEQFLNEKRQHETQKCDGSVDKHPDPQENSAKSTLRSNKEPTARDLMGACKEFVFRKPPRLAKVNAQPRSLRSKVVTEAAAPCRPAETAQSKGGAKRGAGKRGKRVRSAALVPEAPDSSSDDGIEEAIQLYQLEKTRKEASGDPPQSTQLREKGPEPPTHSTSTTTKSALPETYRKTPSKRKQVATRATDPSLGGLDSDHPSKLPKETKASPPGNTAARGECVEWSSCRADTSAELMCAEAILDISKTILPAPVQGSDRALSASPLFSPNVPSRSGDSSSVDSDDSIEQEIRTFLALKAQSGSLLAKAEGYPQSAQDPLAPNGANNPKAPLSKTPDMSLSWKRKRRGGVSAIRPSTPKQAREVVRESAQGSGHEGQVPPCQGGASESPGREGEARGQPLPPRIVGLGDTQVSPGHSKVDEARSVDGKESSEDKSSSLDSDEDLDTAIKDLLRSKRRLRRRGRDPRAACKKKVRFSTTETRFLDKLGSFQRHWKDRSPHVLKSCLSKSRRASRESPVGKLPSIFSSITERTKLDSTRNEDAAPAFQLRRRAEGNLFSSEMGARDQQRSAPSPSSLSDDSSSVDSNDSIELEIRKFLAEKAKESVGSSEIQGGGTTALGSGGPARPEVLCRKEPAPQPGMCTRSQRARGAPLPAEGLKGAERAGAQSAASLFIQGRKGTPRGEPTAGLPGALARCELAPRSTSGNVPAKGSPVSRRNVYGHKDQSQRGVKPATPESAFGQLSSCARAGTEAGGTGGTFHMTYGSPHLLTPSLGAERDGRTQADRALPWSDFTHQSRLPSLWALNSDGRDLAWRGSLGSEREKGAEGQARGPPSLPFAGFSPLLSTQLFHFGKSVSWGGKPASLFSPYLGLPLQGPAFSAFRETQAGPSPVFGSPHLLMKKEGGHWPSRKAQAGLSLHDRRNSGSEENLLDLRYRGRAMDRDDPDQEALGSDASEFSDTSVEDGGGRSVVKGKALQL